MPHKFPWGKLSRPKASEERFDEQRTPALPVLTPESPGYTPYRATSVACSGSYDPSYAASSEYNNQRATYPQSNNQGRLDPLLLRTPNSQSPFSSERPDSRQSNSAESDTQKLSRRKLWRTAGRSRENLLQDVEDHSSRFHFGRKTSIHRKDPPHNRTEGAQDQLLYSGAREQEERRRFYGEQTEEGQPELPSLEEQPRLQAHQHQTHLAHPLPETQQPQPSSEVTQRARSDSQPLQVHAKPVLQRSGSSNDRYFEAQSYGGPVEVHNEGPAHHSVSNHKQDNSKAPQIVRLNSTGERTSKIYPMESIRYSTMGTVNREPARPQNYSRQEDPLPSPTVAASAGVVSPGALRPSRMASADDRVIMTPVRSTSDTAEQNFIQLQKDQRELKEKYNKVKRLYFEKDEQVKQLQNTLANQRLAVSRTTLDDSQYIERLTRLDGLIAQLAFGMRKDWKSLPEWLQPSIPNSAIALGKQEMTAAGRAFISRWLAEEVLNKYFHPSLELSLSKQLKTMQYNICSYSAAPHSSEEDEALGAKIVSWRLATIDGLKPILSSAEASEQRKRLISSLIQDLTTLINSHMKEPVAGLEAGISMIIEGTIGILANLPLESRDVEIEYYLPGSAIIPAMMNVEQTAGVSTAVNDMDLDSASSTSGQGDAQENLSEQQGNAMEQAPRHSPSQLRKSFLGSMIGSKRSPSGGHRGQLVETGTPSAKEDVSKVRLCLFLAAQIRGRTVLCKAPVFAT